MANLWNGLQPECGEQYRGSCAREMSDSVESDVKAGVCARRVTA